MEISLHKHSHRFIIKRSKVHEDPAFRILYRLYPERVEEEGERIWCFDRELHAVLDSIECEC